MAESACARRLWTAGPVALRTVGFVLLALLVALRLLVTMTAAACSEREEKSRSPAVRRVSNVAPPRTCCSDARLGYDGMTQRSQRGGVIMISQSVRVAAVQAEP